jgi:hypothetical protein
MLAAMTVLISVSAAPANAGEPGARAKTAIKLNRGLQNTPMRGTGWKLEAAGFKHKIHPAFIAAIAGTESSFGHRACRSDRFNAFGLASCTRSWPVPQFRSWKHVYGFMGAFLTRRWPGASTPYSFRGYAACSDCWARRVSFFMRRLGFGTSVRYP